MSIKSATEVEQYAAKRMARRYVPLETVTVTIVGRAFSLAHGTVSNISLNGACLITNAAVPADHPVQLIFRVRNEELFRARARVVWSAEGIEPIREIVGMLIGVAFTERRVTEREKLELALANPRFCEICPPDRNAQDRRLHLPGSPPDTVPDAKGVVASL